MSKHEIAITNNKVTKITDNTAIATIKKAFETANRQPKIVAVTMARVYFSGGDVEGISEKFGFKKPTVYKYIQVANKYYGSENWDDFTVSQMIELLNVKEIPDNAKDMTTKEIREIAKSEKENDNTTQETQETQETKENKIRKSTLKYLNKICEDLKKNYHDLTDDENNKIIQVDEYVYNAIRNLNDAIDKLKEFVE